MNNCAHKDTTVTSFEAGYYIQCNDCYKQWQESELEELQTERYLINYYRGAIYEQ